MQPLKHSAGVGGQYGRAHNMRRPCRPCCDTHGQPEALAAGVERAGLVEGVGGREGGRREKGVILEIQCAVPARAVLGAVGRRVGVHAWGGERGRGRGREGEGESAVRPERHWRRRRRSASPWGPAPPPLPFVALISPQEGPSAQRARCWRLRPSPAISLQPLFPRTIWLSAEEGQHRAFHLFAEGLLC